LDPPDFLTDDSMDGIGLDDVQQNEFYKEAMIKDKR
jgi:hypothetical protein